VQVYGVLTGSMEPQYPVGSLIYVTPVDASELRVNDVITFSVSPNVIATHRIVELVLDENNPSLVRFRTKGDANREVDASLVSPSNVIGKVQFSIPQIGHLANYIQHAPGTYVAILVCGLMIAFVFYTDSLETKFKEMQQGIPVEEKAKFDPIVLINQFSQKLFGKELIKPKEAASPVCHRGYQPQQQAAQQQPWAYQQPYASQPYQQQYPQQQAYMQQMPQQYSQQPYAQQAYQQSAQPDYSQQPYAQQSYQQQGYQQPWNYQQQPYAGQPYPYQQAMPQYPQQSYGSQPNYGQPQYGQQPSAYSQQNGFQPYSAPNGAQRNRRSSRE